MIYIIDYGLGNLGAFSNIFKKLNIEARFASKPEDLIEVGKIILPGVGSFDHAMKLLNESGMREKLDELVLGKKIPVLGVCVGMQILGNSSEEGTLPGLGWIDGTVKKFDISTIEYQTKLPHMGWNDIEILKNDSLFFDMGPKSLFYFLHSFYFECNDSSNILAYSNYGGNFCCIVKRENIYGVQFHPEKSHHFGINLLNNFANLDNA